MVNEYDEFVEKFKPKLTTDDCYTPDAVYTAVKDWAVAEYGLAGREIVRPFWPGADYDAFSYPGGCVVIDNPPFSILAKIKAFYSARKIDYFLFAPHLTLFSSGGKNMESYIVVGATITYENGAKVNTSFVTNLDASFIRTAPGLKKAVEEADKKSAVAKTMPKYKYPSAVTSAALLGRIAGEEFKMDRRECSFTRALDAQRGEKKSIYGGGFLISHDRAAEIRAAEIRAAVEATEWQLSAAEMDVIKNLGEPVAD